MWGFKEVQACEIVSRNGRDTQLSDVVFDSFSQASVLSGECSSQDDSANRFSWSC